MALIKCRYITTIASELKSIQVLCRRVNIYPWKYIIQTYTHNNSPNDDDDDGSLDKKKIFFFLKTTEWHQTNFILFSFYISQFQVFMLFHYEYVCLCVLVYIFYGAIPNNMTHSNYTIRTYNSWASILSGMREILGRIIFERGMNAGGLSLWRIYECWNEEKGNVLIFGWFRVF